MKTFEDNDVINGSWGEVWVDNDYMAQATAAKTNTKTTASQKIRGNSRSKVYHCPGQRDYDRMGTSKYLVTFKSEKEAKAAGYHKAQR